MRLKIRALRDQLYKENLALHEEIDITRMFEEIVGILPPLQLVLSRIAKVAPTDAESNGRVSGPRGAAAKLGIPQSTLDSKIKALKLNEDCLLPMCKVLRFPL